MTVLPPEFLERVRLNANVVCVKNNLKQIREFTKHEKIMILASVAEARKDCLEEIEKTAKLYYDLGETTGKNQYKVQAVELRAAKKRLERSFLVGLGENL